MSQSLNYELSRALEPFVSIKQDFFSRFLKLATGLI